MESFDPSTMIHSTEINDNNAVSTTEELIQSRTIKICLEIICYAFFAPTSQGGSVEHYQTRAGANTFCGTLNKGSLASIQSLTQLQFVRHHLEKWIRYLPRSGDFAESSYRELIHVGELRKTSANGKTVYHWSDGSPLAFTAWSKDITRINADRVCVVLSLWNLHDDNLWDFGDCDDDSIYFLCKYPYLQDKTTVKPLPLRANRSEDMGTSASNTSNNVLSSIVQNAAAAYYKCNSQEYVTLFSLCDGILDCFDGSDERGCDKHRIGKGTDCLNMFQCGNSECVPYSQYCDYIADCSDASDENCDFDFCDELMWQCSNGQCVNSAARCNSVVECLDGSDERDCAVCTGDSFRCVDKTCISKERVCDSFDDCLDSGDEQNCNPNARGSCLEWWKAGYRETGLYKLTDGIDVFNVECDFGRMKTDQTIITKLHDIDYESYEDLEIAGELIVRYSSAINSVFGRSNCELPLKQTCPPNRKALSEHIDLANHEEYWDCLCVEKLVKANGRTLGETFRACSHITQKLLDADVINLQDRWFYESYHFSLTQASISRRETHQRYITNSSLQITLQLGPITCEDKVSSLPNDIPCMRGRPVDESLRCLYDFDHHGHMKGCSDLTHLQDCENKTCPAGFTKCPNSYCIAQRFICDGIMDCITGEDEAFCDGTNEGGRWYCNGYFKCKGTNICLPDYQLCDGKPHCPEADDERICDVICPRGCTCTGFEMSCGQLGVSNILAELPVRGSVLSVSGHKITDFPGINMPWLAVLNMSSCQLRSFTSKVFRHMRNLLTLDLSFNNIHTLHTGMFEGLKSLRNIHLDGNYVLSLVEPFAFEGLQQITELHITNTKIRKLEKDSFVGLLALFELDLSNNDIEEVTSGTFNDLKGLLLLVMTGNEVTNFDKDIFQGLEILTDLVTDDYIFCCLKPDTVESDRCLPHEDAFSSCSDLMRMDGPRFLLWVIGITALLGNCLALAYRILFDRARLKIGYGIFVTHLCVSDFLMGIYLIIIAGADIYYRDIYIWNDKTWRYGTVCQFAGALSTVSSEASVFFISLITIDRLLVIKFPFGNFKFTTKSATITSAISWFVALTVALVPILFKDYFNDQFYSKNEVCLALPLTHDRPKGWEYSISIFVMFNFLIFLLIACGQWMMYKEIHASKRKIKSSQREMNLRVTRNLFLIVATDFLCWCPIGIMGIMALSGQVISGDVYVWACVIILPINSALNPFLYTFNAIRKKKEFLPSIKEQTSDTYIDSRSLHELWHCKNLVGPLPFELPYISLNLHLQSKQLNLETMVKYLQMAAFYVQKLHNLELYHGQLSSETIGVRVSDGEVDQMVLAVSPKPTIRPEDKMQDIKGLGIIARQLIGYYFDEEGHAKYT